MRFRIDPDVKFDNRSRLNIKWTALDGIVSMIVLVLLLAGIYFGASGVLKSLGKGEFLNISNINNISFSLFYGIQVILMLGVVWFFAIFWRRASFKDLGLNYYSIAKTLWYSFLFLIVIFLISFLYVYVLKSFFNIEAPQSKVEQLVRNRSISANILLFVVAVVAPFCEELYFRGFLYSAFKKSWGVTGGLFLSSFLFALAHMEPYSFVPIMIIGWILAYVFEKTKSLFPSIFLHGLYNLVSILILFWQLGF
ncbi:MAG: CPBP family intramembrane metalloprotease [Actinobacteria bacterium]|nr:CPBP family intramembrane metalloprotease [Actinomycetota bacterium]